MTFDPKEYMIKIGQNNYLPVAARICWMRQDHPNWGIKTTPVKIDTDRFDKDGNPAFFAIFHAEIFNDEGKLIGSGTQLETIKGFEDFIPKSETSAIGRALAVCGYGTMESGADMDEGDRLSDSPQRPRNDTTAQPQQPRTQPATTNNAQQSTPANLTPEQEQEKNDRASAILVIKNKIGEAITAKDEELIQSYKSILTNANSTVSGKNERGIDRKSLPDNLSTAKIAWQVAQAFDDSRKRVAAGRQTLDIDDPDFEDPFKGQ